MQLERRAYGAQMIVLMRFDDTEQQHDAVAGELVHYSAALLRHPGGDLADARDSAIQLIGVAAADVRTL